MAQDISALVDQYFEDQTNYIFKKAQLSRITSFTGYFECLHNDFPCYVHYEGIMYPSVNAGFQAARSPHQHIKEKISYIDSAQELWDIAVKIDDPPNWKQDRLRIMETLIRDKFKRNKEARDRLKLTAERELICSYPDATASNLYWGIVEGKGQNQLGRILESVRSDIQKNVDLEKWLMFKFQLETDKDLLPTITLDVIKEEQIIKKIELAERNYFFFGTLRNNHVVLEHPNISRVHACIAIDKNQNILMIDLESKGGTYVNEARLEPYIDYILHENYYLQFSVSTRIYQIHIDYSNATRILSNRYNNLEREIDTLTKLKSADIPIDSIDNLLRMQLQNTILIQGLPVNTKKASILAHFMQYGKVKSIIQQQKAAQDVEAALVTFLSNDGLRKALEKGEKMNYGDVELQICHAKKYPRETIFKLMQAQTEIPRTALRHSPKHSRHQKKSQSRERKEHRSKRNRSRDRKHDSHKKDRTRR